MGCSSSDDRRLEQPIVIETGEQDRSVPVTERGVKLSYLLHLSTTFDNNMTITEIVDKVVRPRTEGRRCCMWEILPHDQTGKPTFFISHTWSRRLCDLLTILTTHFGIEYSPLGATLFPDTSPSPLIWLDILAINQHPYLDPKGLLLDDVSALADVIKATQSTLFCLDNKGVVLTRIWCLYEVWQTILVGGPAKLVVLANQLDADALKSVFIELDVAAAKATQEVDRVRILGEISRSIGAHQMNLDIKKCLIDASELEAANAQRIVLALDGAEDRTTAPKKEQDWQVITNALKPISKHISMLQMAANHTEAGRYSKILTAMQSRLGSDGLIKKALDLYPCTNQKVEGLLEKAIHLKQAAKHDLRSNQTSLAWKDQVASLFSLFLLQKDMGLGKDALATTVKCEALVCEAGEGNDVRLSLQASLLFATADLLLSVESKAADAVDTCNRSLDALLRITTLPSETLPWPAVKRVEIVATLAELLLMNGDFNGSAAKWQELADLWLASGDEVQHLAALSRKGGALDYGGNLAGSEEVFRFIIKRRLELGGPHVNTVVGEYLQLATVLAKVDRHEEAFELHQRVGTLYLGMDSVKDTEIPLPGRGKVNMVQAYLDGSMLLVSSPSSGAAIRRVLTRQQGTDAITSVNEGGGAAGNISEPLEGEDIEDVTSRAYKAWGAMEPAEAERLLRLRIPLLVKMGGERSKEVVDAHKLLASFLSSAFDEQGRSRGEEAEAEYRAALAIHEILMNGRDPDMADQTLMQLANTVSALGRAQEAEDIYRRALDLIIGVFGEARIRSLTLDLQYRGAVFSRVANEAAALGQMDGDDFIQAQAALTRASERVTAASANN